MTLLASTVPTAPVDVIDDRRATPDRRISPRRRILRGGLTGWHNGDSSECIVHNISETGAHLQIRGPVPKTFNLVVDGDHVSRSCCVVWRNANRIGVKFEGEIEIGGLAFSFQQHANKCRKLAERAESLDREALLKMAEAWESLARRSQRKARSAERRSY
jgi:PilZ domain